MAENEVIVETQEVPLTESSMAEYKKARADGKEVATRETVTEKPAEQAEKPRVRGGFQAKIDRLVRQTAALEEAKAAIEKRALEAEAKLNGNGVLKTEQTDGEPKRESFQTDAEYVRALTRWEVKQEIKAERQAEQQQAAEAEIKEARDRYNKRMIALQSENEEYRELMEQDVLIPKSIIDPILYEMENGPEVAIFLAQNAEIREELNQMPSSKAIKEAWVISEKLAADEEEEEEKPEEKAKEVEEKPARKAPAPIRPVSSGSSRSTIPLDKADYQAYKKLRAQGRVQ